MSVEQRIEQIAENAYQEYLRLKTENPRVARDYLHLALDAYKALAQLKPQPKGLVMEREVIERIYVKLGSYIHADAAEVGSGGSTTVMADAEARAPT